MRRGLAEAWVNLFLTYRLSILFLVGAGIWLLFVGLLGTIGLSPPAVLAVPLVIGLLIGDWIFRIYLEDHISRH